MVMRCIILYLIEHCPDILDLFGGKYKTLYFEEVISKNSI